MTTIDIEKKINYEKKLSNPNCQVKCNKDVPLIK